MVPVVFVQQRVKAAGPGTACAGGAFALGTTHPWALTFKITVNPVGVSAK